VDEFGGMSMRLGRFFLASLLLAGIVAPAAAQNENFKFLTGTPYPTQPTLQVGNYSYYVSPYRGQFLSEPGQPTVDIWCVDFAHEVHTGQMWNANFTNMGSGDFSNTYGVRFRGWSNGIAEERYKAAAWLASQTIVPPSPAANKPTWPELQAAIWGLMGQTEGGSPMGFDLADVTDGSIRTNAADWMNQAVAASQAGDVNGSEWTVISDVNGSSNATQEFIARYNVVPEPATILLLATGLAAVAGLVYFRGFSA
jgi:hypothetical protein